jgi:hypothetical protein
MGSEDEDDTVMQYCGDDGNYGVDDMSGDDDDL